MGRLLAIPGGYVAALLVHAGSTRSLPQDWLQGSGPWTSTLEILLVVCSALVGGMVAACYWPNRAQLSSAFLGLVLALLFARRLAGVPDVADADSGLVIGTTILVSALVGGWLVCRLLPVSPISVAATPSTDGAP